MKNAYFVVGAESSGTRMMTRILMNSGCRGTDQHNQYWDDLNFPNPKHDIVFRRSIPHAKKMPSIIEIIRRLMDKGYNVWAIVTARDWKPMIDSQIAAKHVRDSFESKNNIQQAYKWIFKSLSTVPVSYLFVTYESIVDNPKSINETMKFIGRPLFTDEQLNNLKIYNGNKKWYKE